LKAKEDNNDETNNSNQTWFQLSFQSSCWLLGRKKWEMFLVWRFALSLSPSLMGRVPDKQTKISLLFSIPFSHSSPLISRVLTISAKTSAEAEPAHQTRALYFFAFSSPSALL
jgi:hypothetical protein